MVQQLLALKQAIAVPLWTLTYFLVDFCKIFIKKVLKHTTVFFVLKYLTVFAYNQPIHIKNQIFVSDQALLMYHTFSDHLR